jgi:hypothetical protein
MAVKHKAVRVKSSKRTYHIVEHSHTRGDGSEYTHEHAMPHLKHLDLKGAKRVDQPFDKTVGEVTEDDVPDKWWEGMDLTAEEIEALNTDFTVTVSGRFDIDPYGSMVTAIGLTLGQVMKNRGKVGQGPEWELVQKFVMALVEAEEDGVLEFTAEEFENASGETESA